MPDAVRFPLNEWADNPLTFDVAEIPVWLEEAVADGLIVPVFSSEDYWYLDVTTPRGVERIGPDDYLVWMDGKLTTCKFELRGDSLV